ncbi:MAG: ATP synthase F1 subunit delta [Acidobacteriota bacterium]|nr:ATP synthase F1 subunit delta [Acidobacteriota bacterium]MDH3786292.1 ATP synthase F1 subunit delta [Acidobacteriota bacterium]
MKDRKLAVRYARALLSVLTEPAEAQSADQFLQGLSQAWDTTPAFRAILLDPAYSQQERSDALLGMAKAAGLSDRIQNFLRTLIENNRAGSISSIAQVYHEELEARMGIVPAEITTAAPMDESMRQQAQRSVQQATGHQVRLTCKVDADLLGGAITRVGTTIYDGSLRTQLDQLRHQMIQE